MLHFVGDGDQKKFTKNPRHFSMQNSQANSKKKSTKCFWRAVKVTKDSAELCKPSPAFQTQISETGFYTPLLRNTPSTAGNSMTSSGRPSPEPLLKKEAPPAVLGGR